MLRSVLLSRIGNVVDLFNFFKLLISHGVDGDLATASCQLAEENGQFMKGTVSNTDCILFIG